MQSVIVDYDVQGTDAVELSMQDERGQSRLGAPHTQRVLRPNRLTSRRIDIEGAVSSPSL